ncbi:MAG: hypothetical protein CMP23_14390 [Rickettsiales bacterium]|nr:hypothetical protein [Rickettsiales bacterium]|tara:strand:+ start:205 stop:1176 length:972 start_codon:yes stop_codon:yes gene_type:complete
MRPCNTLFFILLTAVMSVLVSCSADKEEDPWAAESRKGSAPATAGFGEGDFDGPQRKDQRGTPPPRGPDTGGDQRSGSDLSGPEDCNDGVDNDGNGAADCEDSGCAADPGCQDDPSKGYEPELGFEDCDNEKDDDKDRETDCEDDDCKDDPSCNSDRAPGQAPTVAPELLAAVSELPVGGQLGMRAPQLDLPFLGRRGRQTLKELRGNIVVLNFWASWCRPCRKETPALELTWQLYRERDVVVIGVSIDEEEDDAGEFLGSFPVSYPMVLDRGGEAAERDWQVKSVPTLILIDRAGRIRERHMGYSPALMRKTVVTIDQLLEE